MRINGTHFVAQSGYALKIFADRKYPKYARKVIQHKLNNHGHMALLITIDNEDYHCEFEYPDKRYLLKLMGDVALEKLLKSAENNETI